MRPILFIFMILMSLPFFLSYASADTIIVDDKSLVIEGNESQQRPLLSEAIELQGPSSSRDFYYNLTKDIESDKHSVTFQIQHSELLIEPSSFTVKIDDTAIKTVTLTPDLLKQSVTVTLPKEALLKGTHKITASFYGILKEGICVPPGNSGNWLRIDILSSISTFDGNVQDWTLTSYPSAFLSYDNKVTTLILPEKASEATLNSSYKLAAYLSEQGENDVQIKRENTIDKITGPVIVVGAKEEFRSIFARDILKNVKENEEDTLTVGVHKLLNTDRSVPVLIVTAKTPIAIQERISLLTDVRLFEQLTGNTITVDELPKVEKLSTTTIPLTQLGFENKILSSQVTMTPHYYVSLPQLEANKEAVMRLVLKKSATLPKDVDKNDRKLELNIYVNKVPHSIDLRKLDKTSSDMYEAIIPIETNILNKQSITDIQFEVTGFQLEDPCETTNERYWLYIDGDSSLTIAKDTTEPSFTLRDFPNAFHDNSLIIIPDGDVLSDTRMLMLYKALMGNGQLANTTLKKNKDVTKSDLQKHAVIFMGQIDEFTMLSKNADKIPHTSDELIQQGFLPEAISQYTFITKNFWQANEPLLFIQSIENNVLKNNFFTHLKEANEESSSAIETKEGQFLTAVNNTLNNDEGKAEKKESVSFILIIEFILLIAVIAVILYFILRKKKKDQ
ncbi:cellulose biosynthesis cyclic di-GMP-binding regulatory protein BcsB [Lysinibacillus sp. NPDC056232]|uniref:cellulose biosynthesis cyclic di-GMP-binding regulatory protein BcsB n=1 Tax=Lysinibacillus sp. NPDC056232 TaxID=3345756 RepID=UPI0035E0F798